MAEGNAELILEKNLAAATGGHRDGWYPLPANGGNVLLPYSTAKISLRLPPTLEAKSHAPP